MTACAFITGVCGVALTAAERAFLREARPWGLILFERNIETPAQVEVLTASFRDAVGTDAPVLVDQEGGRVQRLGPPQWPSYPAAALYGRLYDQDQAAGLAAARLGARLMAEDLRRLGIDVDRLPVADVPAAGADAVIGDRAYGGRADKVAALAAAPAAGLMAGGRWSSICPPMAGPRPTAISSFRWSARHVRSLRRPFSRRSGRWRPCHSA